MLPAPINTTEYHNFLKLGKAVKRTAEGLTDFVGQVVNNFHSALRSQHGNAVCTRLGIQKTISFDQKRRHWNINCTCGVCEPWMKSIADNSTTRHIGWENSNVDAWPVDDWQLAKVFMHGGRANSNNTAEDADPVGIMQLIINCKKFRPLLDIQKAKDVRSIIDGLLQSSNYTVTTTDLYNHIQTMITLLQEPVVQRFQCATSAINDLPQIEQSNLTDDDTLRLLYGRITWGQKLNDLNQKHLALEIQQQTMRREQQTVTNQLQTFGHQHQTQGIQVEALSQQQEAMSHRQLKLDSQQSSVAVDLEEMEHSLRQREENVIDVINQHNELKRHLSQEIDTLKRRRISILEEIRHKTDERLKNADAGLQSVKEDHSRTGERLNNVEARQGTVEGPHNVEDFLGKTLRKKYGRLAIPHNHSIHLDSSTSSYVDDVFVELHLQKYSTETFAEKFSYLDMKERETHVKSGQAIPIEDLFCSLENGLRGNTKDPTKVLVQGKPGVGKTTLIKHMANQWAKGFIWHDIKYLFVIKLKEFQPDDKWTLSELLLDELSMSEPMKTACFEEIRMHPKKVVILIDAVDEFSGYEYSRRRIPNINEEFALSILVSGLISDTIMPGVKVVVTSRPSKHCPVKVFDNALQLCGFTEERIREYVHNVADTDEEADFMMMNIDENTHMAAFCHAPLQCGIICSWLIDMRRCAEVGTVPRLNTMTDLYKQATVQMASKLHPRLKYSTKQTDVNRLFDCITDPIRKHAALAKHGMTSSPPQFLYYEYELDMFGFSEADRNCGFLVESRTKDKRMERTNRPCWSFSHTTMQEFFGALGLLMSDVSVWKSVLESNVDDHMKTMVSFLSGLLGDTKHKYYTERVLSGETKPDLREMITSLTNTFDDDAVTIAAVFETQNCDMVDIVGTDIAQSNMSPSDMRALIWVLEKEEYSITTLRLANYHSGFTKQLLSTLKTKTSIRCLDFRDVSLSAAKFGSYLGEAVAAMQTLQTLILLRCKIVSDEMQSVALGLMNCTEVNFLVLTDNDLSDPEACACLSDAMKKMTSLQKLVLQLCNIGSAGMCTVAAALTHCSKLDILAMTDNDISDPQAAIALSGAIQRMTSLQKLILQACNIGPVGMKAVATSLYCCPNVDLLVLSDNDISDPDTPKALGEAMQKMTSLKQLQLQNCRIGSGGMGKVANALSACPYVEELWLTSNDLSDTNASKAISVAIQKMASLRELNLQSCNIGSDGMSALATALLNCTEVELLELTDNNLSIPEACKVFAEAIQKMTSLKKLNLQSCKIGPEGMSAVATALLSCPKVEVLYLTDNDLSDPGASKHLGDAIHKMISLQKLSLQFCKIGPDGMSAVTNSILNCPELEILELANNDLSNPQASKNLGDAIRMMISLQKLDLQSCKLGPEGMAEVASALLHCPKVEVLELIDNDISDHDTCTSLSAAMHKMTSLQKLNLQACSVGRDSMKEVATALTFCPDIEELWLRGNDLSDPDACRTVGDAIMKMTTLRQLNLHYCNIGSAGMYSVVTALVHCQNVEVLELTANDLSDPDVCAILGDVIQKMTSLKTLSLSFCKIKPDGMSAVTKALLHCRQLEVLQLSENDLSDPGTCQTLADAIGKMTSLQQVCLQSCNIGPGEMCAVTKALLFCPQVEVLLLADNDLSDPDACKALGEALRAMTCLQKISLQSCKIGRDVMSTVIPALVNCQKVEQLQLTDNDLSDPGTCKALSAAVQCMTSLKDLSLQACAIGSNGMAGVATALTFCPVLRELWLTGNDLGDPDVCRALGGALGKMTYLQTLILHSCGIGANGMDDIMKALSNCPNVEKLCLAGNDLSDSKACPAIGSCIQMMTSLRDMKLTDNGTSDPCASTFMGDSIQKMTYLCDLNLQSCNIGPIGMQAVARALSHCPNLQVLEVTENDLSDLEACTALGNAIEKMTHLQKLNLHSCNIGVDGMAAVASSLSVCHDLRELWLNGDDLSDSVASQSLGDAIRKMTSLQTLSLQSCDMNASGMCAVAKALLQCSNVQVLALSNNDISNHDASSDLGESIQKMSHLRTLNLQSCGIESDGMGKVASALSQCPCVQELWLTHNVLSDPGVCEALSDAIQKMTFLRELDLQSCVIGADGMCTLTSALSYCPDVNVLELTENDISEPDACNALSLAIRDMTSLRKLNLQSCAIGSVGMRQVTSALTHCTDLEELWLTDNDLSDDGVSKAVGDAIQNMTSLRKLNLHSCDVGSDGMSAIATALLYCPNVEVLELSENDLSDLNACTALSDAIQMMPSLQSLNLQQCEIESDGMRVVGTALSCCRNLEELWLAGNDLGDPDVSAAVGQSIRGMPSLRELTLHSCNIGARGMCAVTAALLQCHQVEVLALTTNDLSDPAAAKSLSDAIEKMPLLEDISMQSCNIGLDGMRSVTKALIHSPQLEVLALCQNNLSDHEASLSLCTAISDMSLRKLLLNSCQLSCDAALALAGCVKHCPELECLWLSGNDIGRPHVIAALATSLASTPNLSDLGLARIGIEGDVRYLERLLNQLPNLKIDLRSNGLPDTYKQQLTETFGSQVDV